jgi:hypothetical protein
MAQRQKDENLMVVAAVEGYSHRHKISSIRTLRLFKKHNITALIRKHYKPLHTQSLEENVFFAEDILNKSVK